MGRGAVEKYHATVLQICCKLKNSETKQQRIKQNKMRLFHKNGIKRNKKMRKSSEN